MEFLDVVDRDHGGKVRIEIDLARSKVQLKDVRVVRVELWIRILLGSPELIGGKLVYPVELPGVGTYARCADGDVPDERLGQLVLKRALDIAWRGAAVLLDVRPTTPLDLGGMELAGSGQLIGVLTRERLGC